MAVVASRESFPAYVRRDGAALARLATRLTGRVVDGEDLAQDVLERLARNWGSAAALDNLDAYARRALINLSRTRHRRRQAEREALARLKSQSTFPATGAAGAAGAAEDTETEDGLWASVRALPGRQPAVIALVVLEDRSHVEVAAILGISAANARQIYHRACVRLRLHVKVIAVQ
ncbi:MAG: RNA polymerase sigma factor [Acidimicrobiales bacterium]